MDNKEFVNDKIIEQVAGGSGLGDSAEPGNWYRRNDSDGLVVSNIISEEYFYCKSDAGDGYFIFERYLYTRISNPRSENLVCLGESKMIPVNLVKCSAPSGGNS